MVPKTNLIKVDDETFALIGELKEILLERGLWLFPNDVKANIDTIDKGTVVKICCKMSKNLFVQYDKLLPSKRKVSDKIPKDAK